jgi:anti-sigma regulatory factor (Ser/Thr protein kinase)
VFVVLKHGNSLHMKEIPAFSYTIPGQLEALPRLRAALRSWLGGAGIDPATREDVVLAAWEICANAVEHPIDPETAEVTVNAWASPHGVRIAVHDSGSWRAAVRQPGRGLGLRLARAMTDRLLVLPSRPGTDVVMWRSTDGAA